MTTVAVLGGGVAGLSAAHELAERGFAVTVYEQRDASRRQGAQHPVPARAPAGARPARPSTASASSRASTATCPTRWRRIPAGDRHRARPPGRRERILLAQAGGGNELVAPAHAAGVARRLRGARRASCSRPRRSSASRPPTYAFLVERLLTLLTSCDERRFEQWELQSWWEFVGAEHRCAAFQQLPRRRAHAHARRRARRARSARAPAALILSSCCWTSRAPAAAPTACSTRRPARPGSTRGSRTCAARGVDCGWARRSRGSTLATGGSPARRSRGRDGDRRLLRRRAAGRGHAHAASPALRAAEPRLNGLDRLVTRWMNGVLFYLDRDVPLVHGHAIYIDSEWALTSISQRQFWPGVDLARRGDGRVGGILSVDVSEWQRAGQAHRQGRAALHAARRSARRCGASSRTTSTAALDGVRGASPGSSTRRSCSRTRRAPTNLEPLLVNTAGSWADRPGRASRGSRTCSWPPTTCAPTPTWRRWRAPTRRRAGRSTRSSTRPARARRAARCGRCASRAVFARRAGAGPAALEAVPPAGRAAAGALRGGRAASDRDPRPARCCACLRCCGVRAERAQARRRAALLERVEAERLDRPDGADRVRPVAARRRAGRPRRGRRP